MLNKKPIPLGKKIYCSNNLSIISVVGNERYINNSGFIFKLAFLYIFYYILYTIYILFIYIERKIMSKTNISFGIDDKVLKRSDINRKKLIPALNRGQYIEFGFG